MKKYPVYKPSIGEREKELVLECLETSWVSSRGRFIEIFEKEFSRFVGVAHSATVVNGTCALHLALLSLGITRGDEVIVPTLTYIASVNSIYYTGATPVFVDSDPFTWQMNPDDVEQKISEKTKAIMVVHLYGHPCDMARLKEVSERYGVRIVEDCCEALGSRFEGRHVGLFGDCGVFSFYGNKTITTGEGGMIVSDDESLIQRAKHLRGQGQALGKTYWHDVVGYNYRMTNISAALGVAQLERASEFISKKRAIAKMYRKYLDIPEVQFQGEDERALHSYWMVSVLVPEGVRDSLMEFLMKEGIETRPVFPPVHLMPIYSHLSGKDEFPVACELSRRGINLPSYPELEEEDVGYICEKVRRFFGR